MGEEVVFVLRAFSVGAFSVRHFLQAARATNLLENEIWDWSTTLPDKGVIGTSLKALMGYSDRPTQLMLAAFGTTMIVFILANHFAKQKPKIQAA